MMAKKDLIAIVLIFLVSFPAVKNLLKPGFFQTFDGDFHLAHIFRFDQALRQRHFPVRWVEELNRGRGYPFFNFYYPLLYYLTEVPYALGLGLTNSLKLVLLLTFPISGIGMYLWIKQLFGRLAGWVSAVIYMYVPYRFVSIYVAARFGEVVAFTFVPLSLWAMTRWVKTTETKFIGLAAGSWAMVILSHNIQSFVFAPVILGYLILSQIYWNHRLRWKQTILLVCLALGAAAYFWMPVLVEKKWTLQGRQPAYDYQVNFPNVVAYFYQPWGYGLNTTGKIGGVSLQLGIGQWLALGGGIVMLVWLLKFSNQNLRQLYLPPLGFFLGIAAVAFFLMNRVSQILWQVIPLLPEIQIPSRLLGVLAFCAAVVGGMTMGGLKHYRLVVTVGVVLLVLYVNRNYARPGYFERYGDDDYLNNVDLLTGTTDPYGENVPLWSRFSMETYADKVMTHPRSPTQVEVGELNLEPRKYKFTVSASSYAWVKVMALYYPGWKIELDDKPYRFQFQQSYGLDDLGLLSFAVPYGEHKVKIWWEETPFRQTVNAISLLSWLAIVALAFASKLGKKGDSKLPVK